MSNSQGCFNMHRLLSFDDFKKAIELSLASALSLWLGQYLYFWFLPQGDGAGIAALWAMISTVLILEDTIKRTLRSGLTRTFGTICGVIGALCVLPFASSSFPPLVACFLAMFLSIILCCVLRVPCYRLAALSVALIYAVSHVDQSVPLWLNGLMRALETFFGVVVALCVNMLVLALVYFAGHSDRSV